MTAPRGRSEPATVVGVSVDDCYDVWVCPVHGIISEDELLEGHDGTMFGPHPGTDGYTDDFFCGRDHDEHHGPAPEAVLVNVRPAVEGAINRWRGRHA